MLTGMHTMVCGSLCGLIGAGSTDIVCMLLAVVCMCADVVKKRVCERVT